MSVKEASFEPQFTHLRVHESSTALIQQVQLFETRSNALRVRVENLPRTIVPSSIAALGTDATGVTNLLAHVFRSREATPNVVLQDWIGQNVHVTGALNENGKMRNATGRLIYAGVSGQGPMLLDTGAQHGGVRLIHWASQVELADKHNSYDASVFRRPSLLIDWDEQRAAQRKTKSVSALVESKSNEDNDSDGKASIELIYALQGGVVRWSPSYIMLLSDTLEEIQALRAMATVENTCDVSFLNARLTLSAGDSVVRNTNRGQVRAKYAQEESRSASMSMASASMDMQSARPSMSLGGFREVYALDGRRFDLGAQESTDVTLFTETQIPSVAWHRVHASTDPENRTQDKPVAFGISWRAPRILSPGTMSLLRTAPNTLELADGASWPLRSVTDLLGDTRVDRVQKGALLQMELGKSGTLSVQREVRAVALQCMRRVVKDKKLTNEPWNSWDLRQQSRVVVVNFVFVNSAAATSSAALGKSPTAWPVVDLEVRRDSQWVICEGPNPRQLTFSCSANGNGKLSSSTSEGREWLVQAGRRSEDSTDAGDETRDNAQFVYLIKQEALTSEEGGDLRSGSSASSSSSSSSSSSANAVTKSKKRTTEGSETRVRAQRPTDLGDSLSWTVGPLPPMTRTSVTISMFIIVRPADVVSLSSPS